MPFSADQTGQYQVLAIRSEGSRTADRESLREEIVINENRGATFGCRAVAAMCLCPG